MDVVGVLVRTLIVIGDQYLRLVLFHQAGDPRGYVRLGDVAERVRPVLVVPVRHAGVVVTEQFEIADTEDLGGFAQLSEALAGYGLLVMPVWSGLDPRGPVAELTAGAGDDHGSDALGGVGGQHAAGARRFVVGMGMDGHHRELF